ncbi:BON domain-containing protein [Rhizobium sp. TH2]|uniref:BON domain-containing protein n=1 Tax=Rhizobium sp. TH2 TaxID=2775403 RepID=UPI00215702B5|nr:BON domain-containing protein [Rhizobium sp. TH2]UVC08108.1 BON domain-containing protein [Rhizobium sp. TH2]
MVFKPQTFHDVPPQAEIDNPTQAGLEARVAEALARAGAADSSQVEVTVEGSVVILTGTVGTSPEIGTVAEVAARVPGVASVDNRVQALRAGLH